RVIPDRPVRYRLKAGLIGTWPIESGMPIQDLQARRSNMPYSLTIIWREPRRYLPALLAVAFSDLLITVQVGLLLGAPSLLSLPIDHSGAEVWVASPEVLSIELGYPIPESWRSRLASMPEVVDTEPYLYGYSYWRKPRGGSEVCCVIGSRLEPGALGVISD